MKKNTRKKAARSAYDAQQLPSKRQRLTVELRAAPRDDLARQHTTSAKNTDPYEFDEAEPPEPYHIKPVSQGGTCGSDIATTESPVATQRPRPRHRNKAKPAYGELGHSEPNVQPSIPAPQMQAGLAPAFTPSTSVHSDGNGDHKIDDDDGDDTEEEETQEGEHCDSDEDSVTLIYAPTEMQRVSWAHVHAGVLQTVVSSFGPHKWTKDMNRLERLAWVGEFLADETENPTEWLQKHQSCVRRDAAKKLISCLNELRNIYRGASGHPDDTWELSEEVHNKLDDILRRIKTQTRRLCQRVLGIQESNAPRGKKEARKRWYSSDCIALKQHILPFFAITIYDVFLHGTHLSQDPPEAPENVQDAIGHVNFYNAQVLLWLVSLLQETFNIFQEAGKQSLKPLRQTIFAQNSDRKSTEFKVLVNLRHTAEKLEALRAAAAKALDKLEDEAEEFERKERVSVKDEEARRARQERIEARHNEQVLQMLLFVESTHSLSLPEPPTVAPRRLDEYTAVNDGWQLSEDRLLVRMMRKVRNLNMANLAKMVPGRDKAEVADRVGFLRRRCFKHYLREGLNPPKWTYELSEMQDDAALTR